MDGICRAWKDRREEVCVRDTRDAVNSGQSESVISRDGGGGCVSVLNRAVVGDGCGYVLCLEPDRAPELPSS